MTGPLSRGYYFRGFFFRDTAESRPYLEALGEAAARRNVRIDLGAGENPVAGLPELVARFSGADEDIDALEDWEHGGGLARAVAAAGVRR